MWASYVFHLNYITRKRSPSLISWCRFDDLSNSRQHHVCFLNQTSKQNNVFPLRVCIHSILNNSSPWIKQLKLAPSQNPFHSQILQTPTKFDVFFFNLRTRISLVSISERFSLVWILAILMTSFEISLLLKWSLISICFYVS